MSQLDDHPTGNPSVGDPPAGNERPRVSLDTVLEKLDAVSAEVRRQGRAGVAAQAAAEACLREVSALNARASSPSPPAPRRGQLDAGAIQLLIPLFDAIDSAVHQLQESRPASPLASPRSLGRRVWSKLEGWGGRSHTHSSEPSASDEDSVRLGLQLIQAEARSALRRLGVDLDDRAGIPVDPERHRVVRALAAKESDTATVLEVLRPAYLVDGVCVREADVVAARAKR